MHFVKKQPTTEEERALKAKERAAKLKAFIALRDRIFAKREAVEKDVEQLQQIAIVLAKNPDIYTFWNIRREVLIYLEERIKEESPEEHPNKMSRLIDDELALTRLCIESNPKSYSAWHHRGWALARHPNPNCEADLKLCEKALQMDCRNFHVWDHRRFVASLAKLSMDEEIEFSNKMISLNFSNFSAWHYRGDLFLRKAALLKRQSWLGVDLVKSELKKVISAFYTDPDDQSAWIYSQFLADYVEPGNTFNVDEILSASLQENVAIIVFNQAQTVTRAQRHTDVDGEAIWSPISRIPNSNCCSAKIWEVKTSSLSLLTPEGKIRLGSVPYINKKLIQEFYYIGAPHEVDGLDDTIHHIQELLKEEKNSVWGILTLTIYLLRTAPVKNRDLICGNLERLCEIDQKRINYYLNLRNRVIIGSKLLEFDDETGNINLEKLLDDGNFTIHDAGITNVDFLWPLSAILKTIDVSSNNLKSLDSIRIFRRLTHVTAANNQITRLPFNFDASNVEFLSVAQGPLNDLDSVKSFLRGRKDSAKPFRLLFAETPLSNDCKELFEVIKGHGNIRLIPYWL